MPTATMTSKGQVTVPADVRERLRLVPGSKLDFIEQPDGSFAIKAKTGDIRRLKGIVRPVGAPHSAEDMDKTAGQAIADDCRRSIS